MPYTVVMKTNATEGKTMKGIKYDASSLASAGPAAQKLARMDGHTRYIVCTAFGYQITTDKPAVFQKHITVNPDGSHD